MQSFIDIAHNVLFCRPPLAEGRENEHDLDAGNSKVIDLSWSMVISDPFEGISATQLSQGQDRTDQEEKGRVAAHRPEGLVPRTCDQVGASKR